AVLQERCKNGATYWCTVLQDRLAGTERPPSPSPEPPEAKEKTVIYDNFGGTFGTYFDRFKALNASGNDVEIRGACISACTLITFLIQRKRLCFDKNAWLGFHQASLNGVVDEKSIQLTELIFDSYPSDIRRWLQDRGGTKKMPGPDDIAERLWIMPASELW